MRTLITGGAGFLGAHLAERLLARGDSVSVIDVAPRSEAFKIQHLLKRPDFRYYRGSVLDKDLVDKLAWDCDRIFHFAALVGVDKYVDRPFEVLDVNINGTKLVLDLALKYDKKVIFASTSEIYGKNTKIPFQEDDDRVLGPTTVDRWCYSSSKAVGEHFCFAYHNLGLPVVVLRFFNVYGPGLDFGEPGGRVIAIFLRKLTNHEPLPVIGDGKQTRCFTYVDDTISGVIRAADVKGAEGLAVNIGTNVETRIADVARLMLKLWGSDAGIQFTKGQKVYGSGYEDIRRRVPDTTRARKLLGFRPKISLEHGLKKTIEWFQKHPPNPPKLGRLQ